MPWFYKESSGISQEDILGLTRRVVKESLSRIDSHPKKVLLLPPDITRAHSGAGWITEELYKSYSEIADVHVIPTLGQHQPHSKEKNKWMFGDIPHQKIHVHDWINGVKEIGEIPKELVLETSGGKANWSIPIWLNKMLLEEKWDIIINIGHVVPHEVLGFSNHNKNYFIGLGGMETINASHMMAASIGIENNLGRLVTPVRDCFNWAEEKYLSHLPDCYVQLVMNCNLKGDLVHTGFYVGDDLETYLMAARGSRKYNVKNVKPLKKVVALMQGDEFHSTWVANKSIYRTRLGMADGGELIVLAPGLKRFGEQPEVDKLIRKYGYIHSHEILKLYKTEDDLKELGLGTAHLLNSTSDDRFNITYAPGGLSEQEINSVNFNYLDLDRAMSLYNPDKLKNGINRLTSGEEIYFIRTPSLGLWGVEEKLAKNSQ